jgi:hypothetical protein
MNLLSNKISKTYGALALVVGLAFAATQLVFAPGIANAQNGNGYQYANSAKVTVVKYVNGAPALASTTNSATFPLSATSAPTSTATSTTASFSLSAGTDTPYRFVTPYMPKGSTYTVSELTNTSVVGAACADGKPFALTAYTTGTTLELAAAATPTTTAPAFTNLQSNQYVIVWNQTCAVIPPSESSGSGTIGGDVSGGSTEHGALAVTGIDAVDTSATADGTFANGLEYVFHVTVPDNETQLSMKFANWINNASSSTIPVANNMRISSTQADNGGATVLITAANVYSSPALHITEDLNPALPGLQIDVTVEAAVPVGTMNGSYTTSYGVQTLP